MPESKEDGTVAYTCQTLTCLYIYCTGLSCRGASTGCTLLLLLELVLHRALRCKQTSVTRHRQPTGYLPSCNSRVLSRSV